MSCHTSCRKSPCVTCSKSYTRSSTLRAHLRSHSGERPHTCDLCLKNLTSKDSLRSHKATHLPDHAKLSCSFCSHKFSRISSLNRHKKKSCLALQNNATPISSEEQAVKIPSTNDISKQFSNRALQRKSNRLNTAMPSFGIWTGMTTSEIGNLTEEGIRRILESWEWHTIYRVGLSVRFYRKVWWVAADIGHVSVLQTHCDEHRVNVDMTRGWLGDTALHVSCRNGHYLASCALVSSGASVIAVNTRGETPLIEAIRSDDFVTIQLLLCRKEEILVSHHHMIKAVYMAATSSTFEIFQLLLNELKPGILMGINGATLLDAIMKGDIQSSEKISYILEQLMDAVAIDNEGNTALHVAARTANVSCMKQILGITQEPSFVNKTNLMGQTSLRTLVEANFCPETLLARSGSLECLELLLENRADIDMSSYEIFLKHSLHHYDNASSSRKETIDRIHGLLEQREWLGC